MKKLAVMGLYILLANSSVAQIKMPRFITDSMILQRDAKINIWGWASKGEKVSLRFNGKMYKTTAGPDTKWKLVLDAAKAGGPYKMEISGRNKIILKDILLGDVWLCAGQSNMVHQMKLHNILYEKEIAAANFPQIRQFLVPNITNLQAPQTDLPGGSWKWANPANVNDFSAVAYFFARALYEKYQVPIGIINASWGGVPIESMMSEESLQSFPDILTIAERNKDTAFVNEVNRKAFEKSRKMKSPEDQGFLQKWFSPAYQPKEWRKIAVPGYWEDQGVKNLDGVVWYRREIEVPAAMTTVPAKVFLGRIVDADELYINGEKIGSTGYMYPQRRYSLPEGTLKPGKNLLVVRVTNNFGKGGFVPDKPYQLIAGKDTVDLTGYWQYKVGAIKIPQNGFGGGGPIAAQNQPTALFNSMIAPIVPYTLKGFVWYQGESNTGKPAEYAQLQPAMIKDWRHKWKEGNIPFLFVQLPGFMDYNYLPSESQWAAFREAQAVSLSLPNTAMTVAIDLGEWNDIHPDRKKEVGDRLALAAEKIAYLENLVYAGPTYESATISGNKITLSFTHAGSGLVTNNGEAPAEFAIAGEDKKFVWAKAEIRGDKIIVYNDEIPNPKFVRYAWADNPVEPNLYNKEGLPAAPFRTDK